MSESDSELESVSSTENRRTAERQPCSIEVAVADNQQAFLSATVLDLSAGGVKLLVNPPPAPGEHLQLTFMTQKGRLFQIGATVVHYIEYGDTWALGCRFSRDLADDELAAIL